VRRVPVIRLAATRSGACGVAQDALGYGHGYMPCALRLTMVLAVLMAFASTALGQQRPATGGARVGYIYPAGACQGATTRAVVGGEFLDGIAQAYISGSGVQITVKEYIKPMAMQQVNKLRDTAKELADRRAAVLTWPKLSPASRPSTRPVFTEDDAKLLKEIREKLATAVIRPAFPTIAENVLVDITVANDATPGRREVRFQTTGGLTNAVAFYVGTLPEVCEIAAKPRPQATASIPGKQMTVTLPVMINGQIGPGGVNRYQFHASKGQSLVAAACARGLTPYLADAVPGWFQATLALYDAAGHELAADDDSRVDHDPLLHLVIPADGQYVIEIKDSLFRGREDFVYRLALGELPCVTGEFPLGGPAGAQTDVQLLGWNLPQKSCSQDCKDFLPGLHSLMIPTLDAAVYQSLPFAVDNLPECLAEKTAAQAVALPIIINGRIAAPGNCGTFTFPGKAGEQIVAEVTACRLGSPMDSVLDLTDASGKQLACNDDWDDPAAGLITHQADSYLTATLPADGTYFIHLRDVQNHGGPEYVYRLRISNPRPDFQVFLEPSSISVRAGASTPVTVHAIRRDGFTGAINLLMSGDSQGFRLGGTVIPANKDKVDLKLLAPPTALAQAVRLHLDAYATINGQQVTHAVVPADNTMQAFAYWHLVPTEELLALVMARWSKPVPMAAGSIKQATDLTAQFVAEQLNLTGDVAERFTSVYIGQRLASFQDIRAAASSGTAKQAVTAITDAAKTMQVVLQNNLSPAQASKAADLLGPMFGVLERDVAALLDMELSPAKVKQAMPVLSHYVHTAKSQVYDPVYSGVLSREDGVSKIHDLRLAAAKELAPIIGTDTANKWAEQPAMGLQARNSQ